MSWLSESYLHNNTLYKNQYDTYEKKQTPTVNMQEVDMLINQYDKRSSVDANVMSNIFGSKEGFSNTSDANGAVISISHSQLMMIVFVLLIIAIILEVVNLYNMREMITLLRISLANSTTNT